MKQYSKKHYGKYGKSKKKSFSELQYGISCAITYYKVIRNLFDDWNLKQKGILFNFGPRDS